MVRHDRAKRAKKTMKFFKMNYGVKPPYFVLMDPEFIATSLEKKVFVKTAVPELLAGSAVLVVTRCVTAHLRAGGEKYAAAALMAKRLQHEECSHERPLHPHNCLFSLLKQQEEREKKLCLASQNRRFQTRVRELPGIPMLHISNTMVLLDPPTPASTKHADTKARSHRAIKPVEQELVKEAIQTKKEDDASKPAPKAIPHRVMAQKKRAKGPNPLSMRKKGSKPLLPKDNNKSAKPAAAAATTTTTTASSSSSSGGGGASEEAEQRNATPKASTSEAQGEEAAQTSDKRKRKRKRKHAGSSKKASEGGDEASSSTSSSSPNTPAEGAPAKKRRVEE